MGEGVNIPSGFGGLLRYNEEYESKIMLKPLHIVLFIILIVVFSITLRLFFPISS